MPWIVPCIGTGMFGFAAIALGDISLTYLSDSYCEVDIPPFPVFHARFGLLVPNI